MEGFLPIGALAILIGGFLSSGPNTSPSTDSPDFAKDRQIAAALATVRIRNTALGREGSGCLVGKSGPFVFILTAQHLIRGSSSFQVAIFAKESYPKPQKEYASAEVVAELHGMADLALLRLRTTDIMPSYVTVCPESKVPDGEGLSMLTAGCDGGSAPTAKIEKAIGKKIGQRPDENDKATFWEIKGKYSPGRSGGPLIDKQGYLVGICSGTNRDKTYFTHVDEIHRFLKRQGYRDLLIELKGEK